MRYKIAVTATSFCKNADLRNQLVQKLADSCDIDFCLADQTWTFQSFIKFCKNADLILLGKEKIDREVLKELPRLKALSKYGVGLDNIDFQALEEFGVKLFHRPGVNAFHVAEHTLGLILSLTRRIGINSRRLSLGNWTKNGGVSLINKRVGIIGLGNVGSALIQVLTPFQVRLEYFDIHRKLKAEEQLGIRFTSLESIFENCDIITIHTPLDETTRHLIAEPQLQQMKASAFLINTSRGEVVDIEALKNALISQSIAGAACDVFPKEPLTDKSLYQLDNLVCTPHTAGNSVEAVVSMGEAAIHGLCEAVGPVLQ